LAVGTITLEHRDHNNYLMIKCPFCKEDIQDDAIKCKHCGEVLNNIAYGNASNQSVGESSIPTKTFVFKLNPRLTRLYSWFQLLAIIGVLFIVYNAPYVNRGHFCEFGISGSPPFPRACYVYNVGPISIHWMHESGMLSDTREKTWLHILHTPALGVGIRNGVLERWRSKPLAQYALAWLPIEGILVLGSVIGWWWWKGGELNIIKTVTLRFDLKHLGLGEKIILGSASAAFLSLFMPWIAMGIISSSGWNQQGYIFCLLFVYPVIGVFNIKGFNKIAGIICGALALVISLSYIGDNNVNILGVKRNASASGLYLFAASTIGLIVGAWKLYSSTTKKGK